MNSIDFPAVKPIKQEALSVADACRALSISRATLYGEIKSGRLRSYTLGARRYIAVKALHEFIVARETEAAPQQAAA